MSYGITVPLPAPFAPTVERVRAALKEEGFGVLTEIDERATLRRLHAELPRPCSPGHACRRMSSAPRSWRSGHGMRQADGGHGAAIGWRFCGDRAAVGRNQFPDHGETDSGPGDRAGVLAAPEAVEDVR